MEIKSTPPNHTVYLSVGSNMGDKLANCKTGIDALSRYRIGSRVECSAFYRTEPQDLKDQDWFVNAVVKVTTPLDPFMLLKALQSIQSETGRKESTIRFGPRVLDLDILLFDDQVIDSPDLVIPHPRMHKRRFVLKPICDIDPLIIHPGLHRNMQSLLDRLEDDGQGVWPY